MPDRPSKSERGPGSLARFSGWLLQLWGGRAGSGPLLGDLEEEYRNHRLPRVGRLRSEVWFVRQVVGSARHLKGHSEWSRVEHGGGGGGMDGLSLDIRYAVRGLVRKPLLAIGVVATLALGIGVNVGLFSVASAVVFKDLPYQDSERLVRVWPDALFFANRSETQYIAEHNTVFEQMAGWGRSNYGFEADGNSQEVRGGTVQWNHFDMLGVTPLLGRSFRPEESTGSASNVVIISHALWQSRYLGDPSVVGSTVIIGGTPYELIGVLGRDHQPTEEDWEAWSPINMDPEHRHAQNAMAFNGRLRTGVTLEQAQAEMRRLFQEYATERRGEPLDQESLEAITVVPLRTFITGGADRLLLPALVAVGLILLIACGNLSNLLLAHGRARAREMAVRRAIGAGSGRLTRLLLTEGVLLGVLGGLAGLGVGYMLLAVFSSALPEVLPRTRGVEIDGTVAAFALLATAVATLLAWAAPVVQSGRAAPADALRSGDPAASRGGLPVGRILVAGQVALTVVLVGAATLTIRSYQALVHQDTGFDPDAVVTFRPRFPSGKYSAEEQAQLHERILEGLRTTQGVTSAGTIMFMPMHSGGAYTAIRSMENPDTPADPFDTSFRTVSPGYFEAMGIEVLGGRVFTDADRADTEPVVIINESAAAGTWPGESAIGKMAAVGSELTPMRVVGVVADIRQTGLSDGAMPEIYYPVAQVPISRRAYAVRVSGRPEDAMPRIAEAVREVDPAIGILEFSPLEEAVSGTVSRPRFFTTLLSLFGFTALALGAVGVWGVTAHAVRLARRALGIRLALGATDSELVRQMATQGLAPVAIGTVVGLVGFWFASRLFSSFLFNVEPRDPVTLILVPLVLMTVGFMAVVGPALRTRRLHPASILREE